MMRKLAFLGIFCAFSLGLMAQQMTALQYIDMYKDAAMNNMRIKKVPASITLAQGILESGAGNSDLATLANNHFGIKCHNWTGETYYKDDDAPNECFRKYPSVQDSYADHAEFLITRPRYSKCFQLDITDYKGWARELKAAGYATLPTYADKLINTIEKYRLYDFDQMVVSGAKETVDEAIANKPEEEKKPEAKPELKPEPKPETKPVVTGRGSVKENAKSEDRVLVESKVIAGNDPTNLNRLRIEEVESETPVGVIVVNGLNAVYAQKGDTRLSIALRYGLAEWQIRRYNDMDDEQEPRNGDLIFLEPKLEACHVCSDHSIASGEDLWEIAQKYGVKLNALKQINGLGSGVPEPGTVLKLK